MGFVIPPPQQPPPPEVSAGAVWEEQFPKAVFGGGGFGVPPVPAVSPGWGCGAIAWPFVHQQVQSTKPCVFLRERYQGFFSPSPVQEGLAPLLGTRLIDLYP